MKLKLKELNLGAGRPVAFVNEHSAKELNIHVGDRIEITHNGSRIIAVVDIVRKFITKGEILLSEEITSFMGLKNGDVVDVSLAIEPRSAILIAKKLNGKTLNSGEIYCIVNDIKNNALNEAEIAYFVSGVYENGMTMDETIALTEAMYKTGEVLLWNGDKIADKHSIGGIAGNRTTPIVVSICASLGVTMPKTSSRAITSAAGTADVTETLANVDFPVSRLKEIVKKAGACLAWGGSLGLAPVDDKLIRVERLLNLDPEAQLIASILAKKLAVGSKYVLIDIPYGKHAKVTLDKAKKLAKKFMQVAGHFNLKIKVVLTDGSQPIGNGVGPSLEMFDVIKVLKRDEPPKDLEDKAVFLAGEILEMVGRAKKGKGMEMALESLNSGKALRKFEQIINLQGRKIGELKTAKYKHDIRLKEYGKIIAIDNKAVNLLGRILGCPADKGAGIYLHKHVSDEVKKNEPVLTFYAESEKKLREALRFFNECKPIAISKK